MLCFGNQQQGTVIRAFLADFPLIKDFQRIFIQGLAIESRDGQNRDLGGITGLEVAQKLFQL